MERYHRDLVDHPRPLFFLNHSPVGAMFDISDTVSVMDDCPTDDDILDQVAHPFGTGGALDERLLVRLLGNLPLFGIDLDLTMKAAENTGADIKPFCGEGTLWYTYGSAGRP